MKCEVCGEETPFFTETYDPEEKKSRTIYLCKEHQSKMYKRIVDAMLYMHSEQYTGGILKIPEISDADKEAIKKAMESDDTAMPIIVSPTSERFKDIAKVLDWLYTWGIHIHGMSTEIEDTIRRIGGVAQPVKTYSCENCANENTDICDKCMGPNEAGAKPGKWEQKENCSTCKYDYSPLNARCVGCKVILPVYPHGIEAYQHWESKEGE